VDWCEANYLHSPFIAETVNTFTAFFYVIAAYFFYKQLKSLKILPFRFYLLNLVFLAVAVVNFPILTFQGTIMFHSTLKRYAQLLDEFPMIYGVSIIFYCLICNDKQTSTLKKSIIGSISFIFSLLVTLMMIFSPNNPVFFFATFTVIITVVFFLSLKQSTSIEGGLKMWLTAAALMIISFIIWV
jgi:dihydroceramidase